MLRFNCAFGHSRVYNETRPNLNIPLKDPAYVLIILQRRLHSRSPQKRINDVAETSIRRFPLFPPVPRIPIGNVTRIHNSLYRINTQSLNLARPPFSSLSTLPRPSSLVSARAPVRFNAAGEKLCANGRSLSMRATHSKFNRTSRTRAVTVSNQRYHYLFSEIVMR